MTGRSGPSRILLVEDSPADARLLEIALAESGLGHELVRATTAADGIRRLGEQGFDVLLLDLTLPDVRGTETLRRLLGPAGRTPIVILTGLDDEQAALDAMRLGAQDYLVKGTIDGPLLKRALRYAVERKGFEEQARQLESARDAARVRDEVMAMVSHDLRQPLSVIVMQTQILLKTVEARHHPGLVKILRSVEQMKNLLEDLVEVARLEAGGVKLDVQPIPARQILLDAFDLTQPLAAGNAIDLDVVDESEGALVLAERSRVLQVLSNLVGNALKFTAPAGKRITVAVHAAEHVVFVVRDTGPGMTAEQARHAFDRFWQAKHTQRGSAGLGLAIAKGLVEAHGGTITIDSEPGRGTTFRFTLRRATPPAG